MTQPVPFDIPLIVVLVILLIAVNFVIRRKRISTGEYVIQGNVAVVSAIVMLDSLLSDWVVAGEYMIPGPYVSSILFSNIPIISAVFDSLFIVAGLTIIGGFLHLASYWVGRRIIRISAVLALIFEALIIFTLSILSDVRPFWIAWITVLSTVVILISTYISRSRENK